jgi:hypothetical protein
MKNLPIGIQDFEKIRNEDFHYVDKTEQYYKIFNDGSCFFLSRPRRFGKSLMLSTLKCLYEGRKELFKGLWIEDKWDWSKTHPVIHVDLSKINTKKNTLEAGLMTQMETCAESFNIKLEYKDAATCFQQLIHQLGKGLNKCVVLVDEYDKPITDYINDPEIAKNHIEELKAFYGMLKSSDPYLHKVVVTGVSKYGKVSIFSDLNNLFDLTLFNDANDICGYSEAELLYEFKAHISDTALSLNMSEDALLDSIREWYNGYSWDIKHKIYNPFSVLNFFKHKKFHNYWFDTGTPTLLSEIIKKEQYAPQWLEYLQTNDIIFNSADLRHIDVLSLLFQTGYLTLKEETGPPYDPIYTLAYPNNEVRISFNSYLLAEYSNSNPTYINSAYLINLKNALFRKEWEAFFKILNTIFASVPYHTFKSNEAYYHSMVHVMLTMTGYLVLSEVFTNRGRIDTVLETENMIVIFEFKMNSSALEALKQIEDKAYAERYAVSGKELIKIGVNFDSNERTIQEWKLG